MGGLEEIHNNMIFLFSYYNVYCKLSINNHNNNKLGQILCIK